MQYTFDTDIVSDLHKDAYGFRPRGQFWAEWHAADDAGKQRIWDGLIEAMDAENARYERANRDAIAATEKRIQAILDTVVGSTRADAIRFLDDAFDTQGDISFLEFKLDVPFGYLSGTCGKYWMSSAAA